MVWCTMLLDPSLDRPHVGFTIGRTMGHAVARNRARRRLRALMSEYSATAGLRPGWYVLGAAPEVASCAAPALRRDVERLVRRLNAIDVREDAT
jgi:ribonuclease P protein component